MAGALVSPWRRRVRAGLPNHEAAVPRGNQMHLARACVKQIAGNILVGTPRGVHHNKES